MIADGTGRVQVLAIYGHWCSTVFRDSGKQWHRIAGISSQWSLLASDGLLDGLLVDVCCLPGRSDP